MDDSLPDEKAWGEERVENMTALMLGFIVNQRELVAKQDACCAHGDTAKESELAEAIYRRRWIAESILKIISLAPGARDKIDEMQAALRTSAASLS